MQDLDETFIGPEPDPRLTWWNPPARAQIGAGGLLVETKPGTDFWQGTHYGFRVDNGHFLHAVHDGDFILETTVQVRPVHQYDQAGLLIRLSPACWLKTSVEFEPEGPNRLGAVVTNAGWSDWSTQDFPKDVDTVVFRVRREAGDVFVEASRNFDERAWTQLRIARLHDDRPGAAMQCGLYACSPKGGGFIAAFRSLRITAGRL